MKILPLNFAAYSPNKTSFKTTPEKFDTLPTEEKLNDLKVDLVKIQLNQNEIRRQNTLILKAMEYLANDLTLLAETKTFMTASKIKDNEESVRTLKSLGKY